MGRVSFIQYLRALDGDPYAHALADILERFGATITEPTDLPEFVRGHEGLFQRITADEWRSGAKSDGTYFWDWWDSENHHELRPPDDPVWRGLRQSRGRDGNATLPESFNAYLLNLPGEHREQARRLASVLHRHDVVIGIRWTDFQDFVAGHPQYFRKLGPRPKSVESLYRDYGNWMRARNAIPLRSLRRS